MKSTLLVLITSLMALSASAYENVFCNAIGEQLSTIQISKSRSAGYEVKIDNTVQEDYTCIERDDSDFLVGVIYCSNNNGDYIHVKSVGAELNDGTMGNKFSSKNQANLSCY